MKGLTELAVLEERLENRYRIEGTVGAGSYGKAVLATRKADGERVVIKQINVSDVDEQTRESAQREAQLLSCFSHPNVVKYYECMLDDGCLNIVMEYASEGELSDAIAKRAAEKKPFTEDEIMMWFVQILLALYHVHSKNILHRDLKSQNIFISEGNILKLGDFGISRVLNSDTELARTVIGTPYYLSPEICEDKPYNRKSDVWALGCVLYELCMLKRAFDGQSLPALVVKILKGKYPPVPTRYCSSLRHLVDTMLQQNPRDRPSIDGILRLSFVRGHVERYAQHVMALSPVTPENLGLPADATPEPRARPAAATPARTPAAGVTPVKARTPAAAVAASVQRSSSGEGAAPLSERSARAPAAAYDRASAAALQAPGLQQPSSRPSSAASSNLDQGLKGVAAPPSADAGAAGFVGGKMPPNARLGAGTWMRNQQAQLAELEGALALKGHGAGAGASAAIGRRNAAQPEAVPSREAEPELVGRVVPAARVGSGGEASSSLAGGGASIARAQVLQMKQAQKEAELQAAQLAVQQERDRKKAAAAKRDAEKSIAVKSRVVERQRETERHLAEQRVREEEKQARARERAEQLRSKEEDKAKLREELAAHMAAHAAQVKAARARVNRDELSKLGADFASRLHHVPSLPGAAAQVLVVDAIDDPPARSNSSGSARPTAASSGSGVSPARPSPTAAATRGRLGAAPSPSAGKPAPQQQQAAAQQEPPWRAARAAPKPAGAAAGFPDVQIFTPFGSELTPGKAAAAARPGVAAPSRSNSNGGQAASPAPSRTHVAATAKSDQDKVLSIWARKGKEELLEVLSQIQEVLAEEGEGEDEEEEDDAPGPAAPLAPRPPPGPRVSAGRAGVQRGKHGGVHLPPEEDGDERGGSGSASARPSGSSDAAGNAHKVEQLRMMLESELGADAFLAAYRYVRQVSRQAEEGGEDDEGAAAQQHAALIHMCGKKAHLAHRIHTLITLEDKVFK